VARRASAEHRTPTAAHGTSRFCGRRIAIESSRPVSNGRGEARTTATVEIFDPTTQRWRAAGALAVPRSGHTATLLPDGRVLVIGGAMTARRVVASAELYDPRTEQATPAGDMAEARYKHGAVLLANGDVLVIGGSDERDWTGKRATTELYDPRTRSFRAGPRLAVPRFKLPRAVLALANGDIAIAGGAATVEVMRDGRSRTLATLDAAYYSTATRLASDELVVIGGYTTDCAPRPRSGGSAGEELRCDQPCEAALRSAVRGCAAISRARLRCDQPCDHSTRWRSRPTVHLR
jgi:hypothetical protein